jgi:hypothetical protein
MARGPQRSGKQLPAAGDRLTILGRRLERERARADRQRRRWQALKAKSSPDASLAGMQWSETIATALRTAEQISRAPATEMVGLVTKFDTAWWWLVEDDSILNMTTKRWLMRFRRELHRLARSA